MKTSLTVLLLLLNTYINLNYETKAIDSEVIIIRERVFKLHSKVPNLSPVVDSIINANITRSRQSIAWKYKNPGNIVDFNTGDYVHFNTIQEGYDRLLWQIHYFTSLESPFVDSTTTIEQYIGVYAEAQEHYIKMFCEDVKCSRYTYLYELQGREEVMVKLHIRVEDYILYNLIYK